MSAHPDNSQSYDSVVLYSLALEFFREPGTRAKVYRRIEATLRRRKLGAFDALRVENLWLLKEWLQQEIEKRDNSCFYISHGFFSAMEDFSLAQLTNEAQARFPGVPAGLVAEFVPHAVHLYYMR